MPLDQLEDSTEDIDTEQEDAEEGLMTGEPPMEEEPPMDMGGMDAMAEGDGSFSLPMAQAEAAGMIGNPGDIFTVKVAITNNADGVSGTFLPGSAALDGPTGGAAPMRKSRSTVMSPSDMGLGSDFETPTAQLP